MNDPEDLFSTGPPTTRHARRLSDPGRVLSDSERLVPDKVASRRRSDPGRGHSVFALRHTLRSVTQQSMNSKSDGQRLSYAETSSATQSFVSMDSGPLTDTPTHSVIALGTASDTEAEIASAPTRHESPTRNNTLRPSQAVGQGFEPRQTTNGPRRQPTHSFAPPGSGKPEIDPIPAVVPAVAADETVRRRPEGVPQRRGTREVANLGQRGDRGEMATDVATGSPTPPPSIPLTTSSARETPAPPPQSDPRRSAKLSATPTIVPNKPPTSRADDNPPPSIQESRPPRPSTGSNRSNRSNRTAPLPPSPELRREEKPLEVPRASTTARPSTGLNGPSATAPESRRQEKPTEAPRSSMTAQRPPLQPSVSQMDTKYVNMLLALDGIPPMYNILANFFTWILLAGFVLFPGTFTNLQTNNELGAVGVTAVNVIKHLSLYVIAWVCTGIGAAGMLWLWYRWQANYIWLVNRIFMPGFLNSLAGVLSTLASVLGTQSATLSKSSKSTIVVTSAVAGICGGLTGFYMLVLIRRIKKQHDAEIGKQRAGKHGEGVVDVSKRKLVAKLV